MFLLHDGSDVDEENVSQNEYVSITKCLSPVAAPTDIRRIRRTLEVARKVVYLASENRRRPATKTLQCLRLRRECSTEKVSQGH
jgi:tRNA A37 N6-isopentenylltransferase MiaA